MTRSETLRDILRQRKTAYTQVFGVETPANKAVIEDLKRFCRANRTTFHPDARVHALVEGRREVVLRIIDHLELTVDELVRKYGGPNADKDTETDHG